MYTKILQLCSRFRRCTIGVTLVEYGVALAVAVLVGAAAFQPVILNFNDAMTAAGNAMADD